MTTSDAAPQSLGQHRRVSVVGVIGELLITFGVLLLLFVTYQLWWTNVEAGRASDHLANDLTESWQLPAPETENDPAQRPIPGDAFALLYIPRLSGEVWGTPVVSGVTSPDLARGVGHYPDTALPGDLGNFAIAGHRATNGEPLRNIDLLQAGDRVLVATRDTWFEYVLERDRIVSPGDSWVIDPVPGSPQAEATRRLITLTTCHPRWASTQRWIWWGVLDRTYDRTAGEVPAMIDGGS